MFHIVLFEPEIPPNTGNVIRLAANTGCTLHLVRPLGFSVDDAALRRAGLDYREWATMRVHDDLGACLAELGKPPLFTFSTRHQRRYDQAAFEPGAALVFGPESRGLPDAVREIAPPPHRLAIPMVAASRSLNLSNAVAVAVYEAWRQHRFAGEGEATGSTQ